MSEFPNDPNKLNIFFWVSENSGVGYYRQYLPAIKLREHKLANVLISDFRWGIGEHIEPDTKGLFKIMNWADIVVVGRKDIPQFYAQWGGIREFFKIPIVMDTDDNVRAVRPQNPGYQGYHPGAEAIVWNKYASAKVFDALTVSTQDLYDFHKKENPKVYLLPNNIDLEWWDKEKKKEYNDGKVRIGFLCSGAHWEGVQIIKKPLLEIMQKYPQVLFYQTTSFQNAFADYPKEIKERITFVPWIKLEEWPKGVKELGLDIGLAPLADNMFNRAKSNLRWMEYSAAGIAPIVSPVKPYLCVKDGVDGIIAKERQDWFDAMELLTVNSEKRYNISKQAYERIKTDFSIDRNIGNYLKVYQEIHDKYHEFFGSKKRFIEDGKKYREIRSLTKD